MTRALMFQGTGSDVGKTVLVAGLCRALSNRGMKVAPFKPQNMSNNAAVARSDEAEGEIGRGQWLQALACSIEPTVHMNPVLLKPQSQTGSQIVVQGQVWGRAQAREYLSLKPKLLKPVMESFARVCEDADIVLVEGAGSPAEINLRESDIANMGFATRAGVPVVLVGDIDRGGVIASIVGTHAILAEGDRAMVAGYLINKFRGEVSLFDDGLKRIREFTGWPSFGVLPWLDAAKRLPAEDSVALDRLVSDDGGGFRVVVPAPGKIANFDDLDPLMAEPDVSVQFIRKGDAFPANADMIVLPGSKSTIADMLEIRENGWEEPIRAFAAAGGPVIGLCGGYQMLGRRISDPLGLEGDIRETGGLGLLDIETELVPRKTVQTSQPVSCEFGCDLDGYEIHMGRSEGPDRARPMVILDGRPDGAISENGNVRGCYLHGLFGSDDYRRQLLGQCGLETDSANSHAVLVEEALDKLAEAMETHLDIDAMLTAAKEVAPHSHSR